MHYISNETSFDYYITKESEYEGKKVPLRMLIVV